MFSALCFSMAVSGHLQRAHFKHFYCNGCLSCIYYRLLEWWPFYS